ncbi:VWA domain-containing protein [Saccharothrix obliqua]|uniref:VWA domain-containing protein n=1 Tax=Saccharothrix obliqua TaxID=2861747 RepID=UPI001C5EADC0|nr:VWA domain-containing protein [Saccharothrix obliqua]MBW4720392.1 VWA domain-containing protein [Saccharothrix obliqua]
MIPSDDHRDEQMAQSPGFHLSVSQNRYLSTDDDEMHAVISVSVDGVPEAAPEVAEVIAIDCSGSMAHPPTKLTAAQRATRAAIDALRDGALFAVVEGTHTSRVVYPAGPRLAVANRETRQAAKNAVALLRANGGTHMGEWLALARYLLEDHPTAVRHVIMLTDGQNSETDRKLDEELSRCARVFTCDARGIGADWNDRELLRIAAALHGTADAVRQPGDLVADFEAMTKAAMDKIVPEVRVVVKTTTRAKVDFLRQTYPTEADLVGDVLDARTTAFATGSWGAETREFHLRLAVDSTDAEADTDIRVARVDLEVRRPGTAEFAGTGAPALVMAHWTADLMLSSVLDSKVAHYTNQAVLGQAVLRGCEAHNAGDLVAAATDWGRAVALAAKLGNDKVMVRLLRLVEVVGDPADGLVRLKPELAAVDVLSAAMGSVVSSMSPRSAPVVPTVEDTSEVECPNCHRRWRRASARFCGSCRTPLTT